MMPPRLRDARVGSKLLIVVAILLLGSAALLTFALRAINDVRGLYATLHDCDEMSRELALLRVGLSDVRAISFNALRARDPEQMRSMAREALERIARVNRLFDTVLRSSVDEEVRRAVEAARVTWDDFRRNRVPLQGAHPRAESVVECRCARRACRLTH